MKKNILAISVLVSSLTFVSANVFANASSNTAEQTMITAKVKAAITADIKLSVLDVDVSTIQKDNKTIVILSGKVKSDTEKKALVADAKNVKGVDEVNADALRVKTSKNSMSDAALTAKVKAIYAVNLDKLGSGIKVETIDRKVILSGCVDNKNEVKEAEKLAKGVEGVASVETDRLNGVCN